MHHSCTLQCSVARVTLTFGHNLPPALACVTRDGLYERPLVIGA